MTTLGLSVGLTVLLLGLDCCGGDDLDTTPWRRSDDDWAKLSNPSMDNRMLAASCMLLLFICLTLPGRF